MKIVVISGYQSSAVHCEAHGDGESEYLGGPEVRAAIADADVVISLWGPLGAIVNRAPADAEVVSVHHKHLQGFFVDPAETEAHYTTVSLAEFEQARLERGRGR